MEDSLAVLSVFTDGPSDVVWHLLVDWDPEELLADRERMKMALARYAKQSLLQWGEVETREIARWCERLRETLENEGPSTRGTED